MKSKSAFYLNPSIERKRADNYIPIKKTKKPTVNIPTQTVLYLYSSASIT